MEGVYVYTAKQQHVLEYVLLSLWVVAEHGFESGLVLFDDACTHLSLFSLFLIEL